MKATLVTLALVLASALSAAAQNSVGTDLKHAGSDTKKAAKTGTSDTKKGVKKGASATAHGVKKGTNKAASATEKGAGKVKANTTDTGSH